MKINRKYGFRSNIVNFIGDFTNKKINYVDFDFIIKNSINEILPGDEKNFHLIVGFDNIFIYDFKKNGFC